MNGISITSHLKYSWRVNDLKSYQVISCVNCQLHNSASKISVYTVKVGVVNDHTLPIHTNIYIHIYLVIKTLTQTSASSLMSRQHSIQDMHLSLALNNRAKTICDTECLNGGKRRLRYTDNGVASTRATHQQRKEGD
jgi:hypothetical protein